MSQIVECILTDIKFYNFAKNVVKKAHYAKDEIDFYFKMVEKHFYVEKEFQ